MSDIERAIKNQRAAQSQRIYDSFEKSDSEGDIVKSEGGAPAEEVEKSDIMNALDSGGNNIKVSKTGKEIKDQIKSVVLPQLQAELEVKKSEADAKLKEVGGAPTKNVDPWWTRDLKIEVGYKVYDWDETYLPSGKTSFADCCAGSLSAEHAEANKVNAPSTQDEANARRAYNDLVRCVCNILVDIKACEIIEGLKDGESYELTARQIISFQF